MIFDIGVEATDMITKKPWFKFKGPGRLGYGRPVSWEGWAITAIYILVMIFIGGYISSDHAVIREFFILGYIAVGFLICFLTSEKRQE